MAHYSKKEMREICDISASELATYVKRRKIFYSTEPGMGDMFDLTNEWNIAFINHRAALKKGAHGKAKALITKMQAIYGITNKDALKFISELEDCINTGADEVIARKQYLKLNFYLSLD